MTVVGYHNMAKMTSLTTGTGTLTLSSAVAGYLSFDDAGVQNGEIVTYTIREGVNFEVGTGTYTTSGTTLTRTTVYTSSNSGSKIACAGHETVFISQAAENIEPFALCSSDYDEVTITNTNTGTLTLDTELMDDFGLVSLASNYATVALQGWYDINVVVSVIIDSGSPVSADGWFEVVVENNGNSDNAVSFHGIPSGVTVNYATFGNVSTVQLYAGSTIRVRLHNVTGESLNAYIQEIRIKKIGNFV